MKTNRGVSLIVLVITIIVMIIIAGAVIISLTDTNVIDQAENAATSYRVAQLEENLGIEVQNALLAKYGTTENVSISIKEILDIQDDEDERIVNIATANSIPANMPAGTYYELDGNRYAMKTRENKRDMLLASRDIDRDGKLVTNTYLVNENFDVYYVISGTIAEPVLEINDEKVIKLVEEWFNNWELSSEQISELKKELYIEDMPGLDVKDIAISFYDENYEYECVYFEKRDRMYVAEWEEVGKETVYTAHFVSREDAPNTYAYAEKLTQIEKELNEAFVGKTEAEMEVEYNNGTLEKYILDNCKGIKNVKQNKWEWDSEIIIYEINFEFNGKDYDEFCDYNTFYFILDDEGKYSEVYLSHGA